MRDGTHPETRARRSPRPPGRRHRRALRRRPDDDQRRHVGGCARPQPRDARRLGGGRRPVRRGGRSPLPPPRPDRVTADRQRGHRSRRPRGHAAEPCSRGASGMRSRSSARSSRRRVAAGCTPPATPGASSRSRRLAASWPPQCGSRARGTPPVGSLPPQRPGSSATAAALSASHAARSRGHSRGMAPDRPGVFDRAAARVTSEPSTRVPDARALQPDRAHGSGSERRPPTRGVPADRSPVGWSRSSCNRRRRAPVGPSQPTCLGAGHEAVPRRRTCSDGPSGHLRAPERARAAEGHSGMAPDLRFPGRAERIRTSDLLTPSQARNQTAPRPGIGEANLPDPSVGTTRPPDRGPEICLGSRPWNALRSAPPGSRSVATASGR